MESTATADNTLKINEIFFSIQGESSHAGKPCVFVRLTYCNLRCSYCDTEYAFYDGKDMTLDAILDEVKQYQCKTIEITGGEPLMQKAVHPLMKRLCDEGYEVLIETGGSLDVSPIDPRVFKIMDLKCPSSKMAHKNLYENIAYLLPHDEVKFVIGNREDYAWAIGQIRQYRIQAKCRTILFSPVFGNIEPVEIVNWMLADQIQKEIPNLRFQIQMHKMIWAPETRGV
ncbi:radical SAM protein [bacterium]|nr:MAG: radical SAM protein [bacterium]